MLRTKLMLLNALLCLPLVVVGCGKHESAVAPATPDDPVVTEHMSSVITYVGTESEEDVLQHLDQIEAERRVTFSADDRQSMIDALTQYRTASRSDGSTTPVTPLASYGAYTSHYEPGSGDTDLWLEYRWWAGSRQNYQLYTDDWLIYWLTQHYYHGYLVNWTWMEGGYQRVTTVVGSALYVPFADSYLRNHIRART